MTTGEKGGNRNDGRRSVGLANQETPIIENRYFCWTERGGGGIGAIVV